MSSKMATSSDSKESVDYLYPDLLSKEGLFHILKDRYVQIPTSDLETLDKESLVELYNKFVLPLPQRTYRDNLRGKEMRKKQVSRDKKRKIPLAEGFKAPPVTKKGRLSVSESAGSPPGPSRGLVNHFSPQSSNVSRLKPPPSCIDSSKKVVKLSSSTSTTTSSSNPKEMEASSKTSEALSSPSVVKLSGDKSNGAVKRKTSDSQEDGKISPKKKINKISWP